MTTRTWAQGYYADSAYPIFYFREQSPATMRFNLLLAGQQAIVDAEPSHCELGFGQGLTLAINAACNGGQWFGNDFMPGHVANAREMLAAFDGQVATTEAPFTDIADDDSLPAFDTISLHGVWSWVSESNREAILRFLDRRLKPGGSVMLSYNALPGWSSTAPVRYLMNLYACEAVPASAGVDASVNGAREFVTALAQLKQGYFEKTPAARQLVRDLAGRDPSYLAHDYLVDQPTPFHFADVARTLGRARLDFAARCEPLELIESLALRQESRQFVGALDNPMLREQVRDVLLDRSFRRDIFVRGARRLAPLEQAERLQATRFVALRPLAEHAQALRELNIPLDLKPFQKVIDVVAAASPRPVSLGEMMSGSGLGYDTCREVVTLLTGKFVLTACQAQADIDRARESCARLNAWLIGRNLRGQAFTHLASPVAGCGVAVARMNQMFLAARQLGKTDAPAFVLARLQASGETLLAKGKPLGPEEALREARAQYVSFESTSLPVLQGLGIA